MFKTWKEKRRLRREIATLQKEIAPFTYEKDKEQYLDISVRISNTERRVSAIETDALLASAKKFHIEIPTGWLRRDWEYNDTTKQRFYLTDSGQTKLSKLVIEARRSNVEWWVKNIGGIIAALIGLAGATIGIIAILKN